MSHAARHLCADIRNYVYGIVIRVFIWILKLGPVPNHVAFIMDGNRRYARIHFASQVELGHVKGFDRLESILDACLKLGLKTVSLYAFSIENFNRPESEVLSLMRLAEAKLLEFSSHNSLIAKHGIRVKAVGAICMLPSSVQTAISKAEAATAGNRNATLYICMPYTARHEIACAIRESKRNQRCVLDNLSIREPLDLLIRTSGETRLSNFMLCQAAGPSCVVYFTRGLWPDFSVISMFVIFVKWQVSVFYRLGATAQSQSRP